MEFSVKDRVFRAGKMDAFQQLHVVRRLAPCLGKLAGLAGSDLELKKDEAGNVVDVAGDIGPVVSSLAEAVAALSDADAEYVINACLEAAECKNPGGGWAPVRKGGATMYSLSLPAMLTISAKVMAVNLSDFFADLPSLSGLGGMLRRVSHG